VVVLWINVPVEFSLLYTTRSSLDLAFKQFIHNRVLHFPQGTIRVFCECNSTPQLFQESVYHCYQAAPCALRRITPP
jgi:hypothetical protein